MSHGGRARADYTRCPRCGRRTVLFHFGRGGEDYLACTWRRQGVSCGWETFQQPGAWDTQGHQDLAAWQALNP